MVEKCDGNINNKNGEQKLIRNNTVGYLYKLVLFYFS